MAKFAILAIILILAGWQYKIHWMLFGGVLIGGATWLWYKEHTVDDDYEDDN